MDLQYSSLLLNPNAISEMNSSKQFIQVIAFHINTRKHLKQNIHKKDLNSIKMKKCGKKHDIMLGFSWAYSKT